MKRLLFIMLVVLCTSHSAHAQGCVTCTRTAASLDDKSAKGLNGGILYLAFLPLTIIGTVGFVWWKYNKNNN